jgi:hypothetical protein
VSQLDGWQDLRKIFVKAFDDKGQQYPIDFDDAYNWLQYGRKDNALRALKARYMEDTDHTCAPGGFRRDEKQSAFTGLDPDKYYLIVNAFFLFALRAPGKKEDIVRRFFIAIWEAYYLTIHELECDPNVSARKILDRHADLVSSQFTELGRQCAKMIKVEAQVRDTLATKLMGARTEVRCEYGVVDILTDSEVIEVKVCHKWKHALGQCLSYGLCFPGETRRVHLFQDSSVGSDATKQLNVILQVCSKFDVKVTFEKLEDGKTSAKGRESKGAAPPVSVLRATAPSKNGNCSSDIDVALVDCVLLHPAVQAVDVSRLNGWEELGKVFVKAFDDRGQRYLIDFDDAYVWLQYGKKDSALRALKARFTLHTDHTVVFGRPHFEVGSTSLSGSTPDKYYSTIDAFERFAMAAQTEAGERVRAFFRAIRDAYLEITANGQQSPTIWQEEPPVGKKHGVCLIGTEVLLAKEKTRQLEIDCKRPDLHCRDGSQVPDGHPEPKAPSQAEQDLCT